MAPALTDRITLYNSDMQLVIRTHTPRTRWLLALVAIVSLGLLGWGLFGPGSISDPFAISKSPSVDPAMENELARYRDRVGVLEQLTKIDKQAYIEIQNTVRTLQRQNMELKQELSFYREVIASTKQGKTVNIQGLRLEQLDKPHRYRFELILTHVVKGDKVVTGDLSISFEGSENGVSRRFSLAELAETSSTDFSFDIKHFRRLHGVFNLPYGFQPERVHVVVHSKNMGAPSVARVFEWVDLVT